MINIMVVEDDCEIRQTITKTLKADTGINVIGEADNGTTAIKLVKNLQPDLVLMDIRLPKLDGLEAAKQIKAINKARGTRIKILILSTFYDDEYIAKSREYGVDGYLLKGVGFDQLASAIKSTYHGTVTLDPIIYEKQNSLMAGDVDYKSMLDHLTKSEMNVLTLIVKGKDYKEIAAELYLSEDTVRNNISSMLSKLGCKNSRDLAVFGLRAGL